MADLDVEFFRYEDLSIPRMLELKEQIFGMLNPRYRTTDPNMLDSNEVVSREISAMLPPEYSDAAGCGIRVGIESLIHRLFGQSMQTEREPFVNESLVVKYLLDSDAPSIVLLNVGDDQPPAFRGLHSAVREFDELVDALDLISVIGYRMGYLATSSPQANAHPFGVKMKDVVLQKIKSEQKFRERMKLLHRFQNASPRLQMYMDQHTELRSDVVENEEAYRLAVMQDLIRIFRKDDRLTAKELESLHYCLQNSFNFDGMQISYGNPRDNICDAVPSCVSGLVGKMREASIVYEADPNIEVIGIVPYLNPSISHGPPKRLDQIVKAITIKAHDRQANDETKLVVDGVIANDQLGRMLGVDWRPYMAIGILKYAQDEGISRVIVNTENSTNHESVSSFKHFIATEVLGLKEGVDFSYT